MSRFFNALMGKSSSEPSAGSDYGFQVLRSSNTDIPLEPWYDFIIGINGRRIDSPDTRLFATEVGNCAGSTVSFTIFSGKGQRVFELSVPIEKDSASLGLALQWSPLAVSERVWHVGEVAAGGPADKAGLLPESDYIVGSPDASIIHDDSGMEELIEEYISRELRLFVYNCEFDVTRIVSVVPSRTWGGNGALGCEIASNLLHRLPTPLREGPIAAPGEALFEGARLSGDGGVRFTDYDSLNMDSSSPIPPEVHGYAPSKLPFPPTSSEHVLVGASLNVPPLASGGPANTNGSKDGTATNGPPPSSRKARKGQPSPSAAFDEYFKEGEKKSKEEDSSSGGKSSAAPPPPPPSGAGAPPKKNGES